MVNAAAAENLETLKSLGIQDTQHARAVASLEHVTPGLIRALWQEVKEQHSVRNPAGLLLHKLEHDNGVRRVDQNGYDYSGWPEQEPVEVDDAELQELLKTLR